MAAQVRIGTHGTCPTLRRRSSWAQNAHGEVHIGAFRKRGMALLKSVLMGVCSQMHRTSSYTCVRGAYVVGIETGGRMCMICTCICT